MSKLLNNSFVRFFAIATLAGLAFLVPRISAAQATKPLTLLNVSYDPTRELWRAINAASLESRSGAVS